MIPETYQLKEASSHSEISGLRLPMRLKTGSHLLTRADLPYMSQQRAKAERYGRNLACLADCEPHHLASFKWLARRQHGHRGPPGAPQHRPRVSPGFRCCSGSGIAPACG